MPARERSPTVPVVSNWVLYGATGYTGVLLAEAAVARGHRPLLAGRNAEKLRALGERLKLEWKAVPLEDGEGLRALLEGKGAVLHAAGPFVETSTPMADACLDRGCSYLDITGELPVFEALFARDVEAKAKQIALIPGVGFDVVPTDCLAAYVAAKLPAADTLEIALAAIGQPSAGTAKSVVGLVPGGSWVRRNGALTPQAIGKGIHTVRFSNRPAQVMPGPIADLVTAWHTTKIPNITVSLAIPGGVAKTLRVLWPFGVVGMPMVGGLLRVPAIRSRIDAAIEKRTVGPDATSREKGRSHLYAKVSAPGGAFVEAWLDVAEGYEFTRHAAISAVERVLADRPVGALSPSQAFGAEFVMGVPGTSRLDSLG
jgi:short subunit dehydrogenase-like uncharacterized protein